MARVEVSLRHAILLDDVPLVRRLLNRHPQYLHNPDFADKSNTSLHLAAHYGLEEMAELLISLGHDGTRPVDGWIYSNQGDNQGVSVNTDGHTPLHLAAATSQFGVVVILCRHFAQTVNRADRQGQTPLHLAAASQGPSTCDAVTGRSAKAAPRSPEDDSTIATLLASGADVNARDHRGNTALHNASAWGNLKAMRALIQAGADPLHKNTAGWTPEFYSITVQAEVYYRNLVAEWEKRNAEDRLRANERRAKGGGAVRLVPQEHDDGGGGGGGGNGDEPDAGRSRPDSARSVPAGESDAGLGINVGSVGAW